MVTWALGRGGPIPPKTEWPSGDECLPSRWVVVGSHPSRGLTGVLEKALSIQQRDLVRQCQQKVACRPVKKPV